MSTIDQFNLDRFVTAQAAVFEDVLSELQSGRKRTHWMWFVFPQLGELGHSATAHLYGIISLDEARAFLAHAVLGPRLSLCTQLVVDSHAVSLNHLFGWPDDVKFVSCMTLFEAVTSKETVFAEAIDRWCDGRRDLQTLKLARKSING